MREEAEELGADRGGQETGEEDGDFWGGDRVDGDGDGRVREESRVAAGELGEVSGRGEEEGRK